MAAEPQGRIAEAPGDFVQFWAAGENGKGRYKCSQCAHGVTVHRTLPVCPKCSGSSWEQAAWSPFGRAERRP